MRVLCDKKKGSVKMRFLTVSITVFCFLALSQGLALAQQDAMLAVAEEFHKIDKDKSGKLSPEEMQSYQEDKFGELDKDKNGYLDISELSTDRTGTHRIADKNMDGKVTKKESDSQFREYFQQMDKDKDGQVSEAEYTDYWKLIYRF